MFLPGTKKIAKILGLQSSGKQFKGVCSGIGVELEDAFFKKVIKLTVPQITYDDMVWLEQYHHDYFAKDVKASSNVITMEFPGFPSIYPIDRTCDMINKAIKYFNTHYFQDL